MKFIIQEYRYSMYKILDADDEALGRIKSEALAYHSSLFEGNSQSLLLPFERGGWVRLVDRV